MKALMSDELKKILRDPQAAERLRIALAEMYDENLPFVEIVDQDGKLIKLTFVTPTLV